MLLTLQKPQLPKSPAKPQLQKSPAARVADAAALAHDVRNWLTVLRIYCDLLRSSDAMPGAMQGAMQDAMPDAMTNTITDAAAGQRRRGWIEELSTAVERGHGLLASLLDAAQPEHPASGAASPSYTPSHTPGPGMDGPLEPLEPLDLAAAVRRRWSLFESMAGERIQVEMDTRGGLGQVAMPEADFERVILNLVVNALDAMADGGRLRITVKTGRTANTRARRNAPNGPTPNGPTLSTIGKKRSLILTVSDTGCGIPPDLLPHIFEPGVSTRIPGVSTRTPGVSTQAPGVSTQTDPFSRIPRGLGLTNVRDLVMRRGGTVRVRANRVRGVRFEIELPLLHVHAAPHTDIAKAPRTRKERA